MVAVMAPQGSGPPSRFRAAIGLGVGACLVIAMSAASGVPASAATGDPLLPDLVTRLHTELYVQAGQLRLSNTVGNRGIGPLEVYPEATSGNDCDADGDPTNDRYAFQRVFQDSSNPNSAGYFVRSQDTASTSHQVGCMVFHPTHHHWHFADFARYVLRTESTGAVAARATKASFCLTDGERSFPTLPGSPRSYYYAGGCDSTSIEGISIGWSDTYGALLDGQSIAIAGLPSGNYCLGSTADPRDRLDEINESNNGRRTRLRLDLANGTVKRLLGACQLP
jgi:hypothetical protein